MLILQMSLLLKVCDFMLPLFSLVCVLLCVVFLKNKLITSFHLNKYVINFFALH